MVSKLIVPGTMLLLASFLPSQARAQCTNANLNGTYFYTLAGSIKSGTAVVSYAELGKVIADGNGGLSGQTTTSIAGVLANVPISGSYSILSNCSGSTTLTTSVASTQLIVQVVDGGSLMLTSVTSSASGELADGRFFRAANTTGSQCGNGTLSGAYGVLLSGGTYAFGVRTGYENVNQTVFDGKGGITVTGVVTTGTANGTTSTGTGSYSMSTDCSGIAVISSPFGTSNYLIARVQGGSVLFLENDVNTTVSGTANPQSFQSVLPQFVFGGGWYSALYFTNPTSTTVSFPVTFTSDGGLPLLVPGIGASMQVTLAPLSSSVVEAQNVGVLNQGYASFSLPAGVTGYGIFRQSVLGRSDQEAVVGFESGTATSSRLIWDDTNFTTSVTLVNPSSSATTVAITVWDTSGNIVGISSQPLVAGGKIENAMRQFSGLAGMAGQRGSALFTVPNGYVSVLGLRFGGSAFTSIPTTQQ